MLYHLKYLCNDGYVYDFGVLSWEDVAKVSEAFSISIKENPPLEVADEIEEGKLIAKKVIGVEPRKKPFKYCAVFNNLGHPPGDISAYVKYIPEDHKTDPDGFIFVGMGTIENDDEISSAVIEREVVGAIIDSVKFKELMLENWNRIKAVRGLSEEEYKKLLIEAMEDSIVKCGK